MPCSARCIRPVSRSSWSPTSSARTATDYWGPNGNTEPLVALTDDSFNYLFVGAVPVILLLWFGIAGGGAFRRGRMLLAATAALALIYALGRYTPAFAWAFDWVPGVSRFRRPVDGSFVFVAMLALICGALLADYIREGVPRRTPRWRASRWRFAVSRWLSSGVVFSGRAGHSGDALMAALDDRADRGRRDPDAGARARRAHAQRRRGRGDGDRGRRAGLVERRVSAQCRAAATLCRAGAAVRRRRRGARSGRALRRASAATMASVRASRSWGSAVPGRTLRWCARSKRSTATIRCASASMIGWWRRANRPGGWSCAISRPPSTATTARSHARSASNSSCSVVRSRRCRILRAGRSPTCCAPVRTSGSTG